MPVNIWLVLPVFTVIPGRDISNKYSQAKT
jgi:hypothetical protein